MDAVLSTSPFLALAGSFAGSTRPEALGAMTVSMLRGRDGHQAKEVARLVDALRRRPRPDVVVLSNSLLLGLADPIRDALHVPVVVTVQGEAHFLDHLDEGRDEAWALVAEGLARADGRIAVSGFAADLVAGRTGLAPAGFDIVHNGIDLEGYAAPAPESPPVLGFLGRLYAPKGLDRIVEVFLRLRNRGVPLRLRLGGTLNPGDRAGLAAALDRVRAAGLAADVEVRPNLSPQAKREHLRTLTVLCVPAAKAETFGTYHLEAMAAGVPIVAPRRGANPEIVGAAGGVLVDADDLDAHADAVADLLADPGRRAAIGEAGRAAVQARWSSAHMAAAEAAVLARVAA
jgi:glycosyltransferase involved in cell wall biosynthesis